MFQFREYLELRFDSVPGARCCFVQTDKTDRAFVCDLSVYSKNRNFRMPFCTKRGKDAPLIPISGSNGSEFDLHVFNGDEKKGKKTKEKQKSYSTTDGLVCPPSRPLVVVTVPVEVRQSAKVKHFAPQSSSGTIWRPSPYSKLDAYVRGLVSGKVFSVFVVVVVFDE